MRNKLLYFTGLAILTAVYAAQPAAAPTGPSVLTFPTYGFRINSFEMPTNNPILGAVQMSWPYLPLPSNKNQVFAPSVNVMVVPSDKGMDDYITNERLGMKVKGFTILDKTDDTSKKDEWKMEYIAIAGNTAMHWYAHAIWNKNRVYIATGGVPDEMWNSYSKEIKECVDSLQATGTAVTPPMPAISLGSTAAPSPAPTSR